ncbi:MAG: tRNA-dihydrouridine synthase [Phycisphaerae bacterium]|nr:tRNA-dihydrouridine synthase [Phycisphaerae bacterium]
MSVEMEPEGVSRPCLERSIDQIASTTTVDSRIRRLVPGFDAPFFQAGLAGYSDGAMRLVARRYGCPFCVTEALLDRTLINGGKARRKEDPDLIASECGMGDPDENKIAGLDDHPIAGQVMGTLPGEMAQAAALLHGMNYDVIDVNLACPVKKIRKHNRGGHFLAYPDDAIEVLHAVREAVPDDVPCTLKLRRAFDDTSEMAENFYRIFEASYEMGYSWATVHCRTVKQKYIGPGKWDFLRDLVRRYPDRLIFGSGDIWEVHDIFAMLEYCGVHAVSVARGCIGNPWIFRQARQLMQGEPVLEPTISEQREALLHHFDYSMVIHGEQRAGRMMRKFGIKFSHHHPEGEQVRKQFINCSNSRQWRDVIDQYYLESSEETPSSVTDDNSYSGSMA